MDLRILGSNGVSLELDATAVLEYVVENFDLEDIYPEYDLCEWATKNGYVRES